MKHVITFTGENINATVKVPTNTLLADAAHIAGIDIGQPCGGQGRCGRCAVQVTDGTVRRRSTLRLSPADIEQGYVLACQTVVEGDVAIFVPLQEKIERRLTTDRVVAEVTVPEGYDYLQVQTIRRIHLELTPPSMDDQTDDWSRLQTALRLQHSFIHVSSSLYLFQNLGRVLREGEWKVTAIVDVSNVIRSGEFDQVVR
ncbi:MAG TPA: 2Fe-2S iron-sulfur cluster-binding protein, partial [Anaerolineales bacterium]|nr:2Fe-2S iron-sulfur cluster-binding protein [Anaerolineales bacterium]